MVGVLKHRRARHLRGLALLTALHDTATLAGWCDHGVLMAEGRIVSRLGPEQLAQARADLAGFEVQLVAALRRSG